MSDWIRLPFRMPCYEAFGFEILPRDGVVWWCERDFFLVEFRCRLVPPRTIRCWQDQCLAVLIETVTQRNEEVNRACVPVWFDWQPRWGSQWTYRFDADCLEGWMVPLYRRSKLPIEQVLQLHAVDPIRWCGEPLDADQVEDWLEQLARDVHEKACWFVERYVRCCMAFCAPLVEDWWSEWKGDHSL